MGNRIRHALRSVIAAGVLNRKEWSMPSQDTTDPFHEVEGIIQQVDPVGRELPVLVNGLPMNFYVPLDCNISVKRERVRMRLLQPDDHVCLIYSVEHGVTIARSIRVA